MSDDEVGEAPEFNTSEFVARLEADVARRRSRRDFVGRLAKLVTLGSLGAVFGKQLAAGDTASSWLIGVAIFAVAIAVSVDET